MCGWRPSWISVEGEYKMQKCSFQLKISGKKHLTQYSVGNGLKFVGRYVLVAAILDFLLYNIFPCPYPTYFFLVIDHTYTDPEISFLQIFLQMNLELRILYELFQCCRFDYFSQQAFMCLSQFGVIGLFSTVLAFPKRDLHISSSNLSYIFYNILDQSKSSVNLS